MDKFVFACAPMRSTSLMNVEVDASMSRIGVVSSLDAMVALPLTESPPATLAPPASTVRLLCSTVAPETLAPPARMSMPPRWIVTSPLPDTSKTSEPAARAWTNQKSAADAGVAVVSVTRAPAE